MVCDKLTPRSEATFLIAFAFAAADSFATVLILNKLLPRKLLKPCGLALAEWHSLPTKLMLEECLS